MTPPPPVASGTLGGLDYLVIALYFALNLGVGWWVRARKNASSGEYFLGGGKIPLWAAAISIYATSVSSISYMALPAYAYSKDWRAMLVGPLGAMAGFVVATFFIGILRRLNTVTVFAYLEHRFDPRVRTLGAGLAMVLSIFGRSSVVLLLPAMALSTVTGMSVYLSIVLMGLVTTYYSMAGGFAAVIWTDVIQFAAMMGGVVAILCYALGGVPDGIAGVFSAGSAADKFDLLTFDWNFQQVSVWVLVGFFTATVFQQLSDQPTMQRAMAAKSVGEARRTLVFGYLLGFPSNPLFFFVGTALFAFYQAQPDRMVAGLNSDAIVPYFVVNELPAGLVGLIIAAIFAAAMSTLSSSLNSAAAMLVGDVRGVLKPDATDAQRVRLGRNFTLIAGLLATAMAAFVASRGTSSLWEQSIKLLSLFGGAFPGIFALGLLTRRASSTGVIIGAFASIGMVLWVQNYTVINPFFHAFAALAATIVVGYAASLIFPSAKSAASLAGLTVWDRKSRKHEEEGVTYQS